MKNNAIILFGGIFLFLTALTYLILFSVYTANFLIVMSLRNSYIVSLNKLFPKYYEDNNIDYHSYFLPIVRPMFIIKDDGRYMYDFVGVFEKTNEEDKLLYFKSNNGKKYAFKTDDITYNDSSNSYKIKYGNNSSQSVEISELDTANLYHVLFASNRNLINILSTYKQSRAQQLNSMDDEIMFIYSYKND